MAESVVMFSGGACSFLAAHRWVQCGHKPVLLIADTGNEDADLWRFVVDAATFLQCELVKVSSGETWEQMILRNKALPSDRMPYCSRDLKVKPSAAWVKENAPKADLVFGLDVTEIHRVDRVRNLWPGHGCHFPMMGKPYLFKQAMLGEIKRLGLTPPRLYDLGYHHNNCSGGCVRNGLAAWRHHAKMNPEHFERMAQLESLIPGYSFTRRRAGDREGQPYLLHELASELPSCEDELFDYGGCGCFVEDLP